MSNDRIHKNVTALGYCCPYGFFGCNKRKSDSVSKLAQKADVAHSTIEFNKRKIRNGLMECEGKEGCLRQQFEPPSEEK